MTRCFVVAAMAGILCFTSCTRRESAEPPKSETPSQPGGGPHAMVQLKDGNTVPGTIVASSQTEMVVAGDDGIERKIPMEQVKSVQYGEAPPARPASRERAPAREAARTESSPAPERVSPPVRTKTYELPAGSEVSVRRSFKITMGVLLWGSMTNAATFICLYMVPPFQRYGFPVHGKRRSRLVQAWACDPLERSGDFPQRPKVPLE